MTTPEQSLTAGDAGPAYAAYHRRLKRWLIAIGGDAHVVDDALQETWVKVSELAASRQWDATRPLLPWLRTVARRDMLTIYRRNSRHADVSLNTPQAEDVTLEDTLQGCPEDYDDGIKRAAGAAELAAVLKRLPPRQARVIVLADGEGKGEREISELLGITAAAVRGLLRKARLALARFPMPTLRAELDAMKARRN